VSILLQGSVYVVAAKFAKGSNTIDINNMATRKSPNFAQYSSAAYFKLLLFIVLARKSSILAFCASITGVLLQMYHHDLFVAFCVEWIKPCRG
jgi:hypothetical protein